MEESSLCAPTQCPKEEPLYDEIEKMTIQIPPDIIFEILTRLPVKSLLRFKCVSTLWFSIITSRHFINSHGFRSQVHPKLLEIYVHFHTPIDSFFYRRVTPVNQISRKCAPPSVHGLICQDNRSHLTISNLSTREDISINFPQPCPSCPDSLPMRKKGSCSGCSDRLLSFGYDPIDSKYKILCVRERRRLDYWFIRKFKVIMEYFVCTLGEKTWRGVNTPLPNQFQGSGAICIKGTIYYMAGRFDDPRNSCLMAFEVRSETFRTIRIPPCYEFTMVELGGCLAFVTEFTMFSYSGIRIMTLEDPIKGVWSCKEREISPCWRGFRIFSGVNSDELLFAPRLRKPDHLVSYNIKTSDVSTIKIGSRSKESEHLARYNISTNDASFPSGTIAYGITFSAFVETLEPLRQELDLFMSTVP